jgi:hypothetical protein
MSKHVWLVKRFGPEARQLAAEAFRLAAGGGLGYEHVCRFVGYCVEAVRQKGQPVSMVYDGPDGRKVYEGDVEALWAAVTRSGHRYAKGRNRENYRAAGERLVEAAAGELGLPGAPPQAVYDYLTERR